MNKMQRHHKDRAVVLKTIRFGDIHKKAVLLTPSRGLIHADAYGASKGKGKLSGVVLPFTEIGVNLYIDPGKGNCKITDAVSIEAHDTIHRDLEKYYAAHLIVELILRSYAAGDPEALFRLTAAVFTLLNKQGKGESRNLIIHFMWKYIDFAGFTPDLKLCEKCGHLLDRFDNAYFSGISGEFLCGTCAVDKKLPLNRGGIALLNRSSVLPLEKAVLVKVDEKSEKSIIRVMNSMIESIIEGELKSTRLWEEQL